MAGKHAKHSALGRGLGALIPSAGDETEEQSKVEKIMFGSSLTGSTDSRSKSAKSGTKSSKRTAGPDKITDTAKSIKKNTKKQTKQTHPNKTKAEETAKQDTQTKTDTAAVNKTAIEKRDTKAKTATPIPTMPAAKTKPSASTGERMVSISQIEPNRKQPRKIFDEDALQELADSIKNVGVIQPLIVRKNGDFYEIIAGERRWRAARMAGLKEVPVLVREYTDRKRMEIALIENIQREDLNPIEEARGYEQLISEYDLTQEETAERVAKSRTAVTNSLRLLKLDSRVQDYVSEGTISSGHARALLSLPDKESQFQAALQVIDGNLSVRETERMVKALLNPRPEKKKDQVKEAYYHQYEETLGEALGSKIKIKQTKEDSGRIEISYFSQDEFDRICQMLMQDGKAAMKHGN